jgi:uncharacterized membrane protein YsdA (DUF1294 family)
MICAFSTAPLSSPWFYVATLYIIMSGVTFVCYGIDKSRAGKGGRRIPERTLHLLELGAGWPGAFAGQRVFRHKTKKTSFLILFWLIGALHLGGWIGYTWYGWERKEPAVSSTFVPSLSTFEQTPTPN